MSDLLSKDGSKHITDERINTIVSLVGFMCSVVVSSVLLYTGIDRNLNWYELIGLIIYLLGLVNLFAMSALHHGLNTGKRAESVLRTLDYCAIFWLIAGTVTALVLFVMPQGYGYAILIATWLMAVLGIVMRAVFRHLPKHITNTLFISLGWLPAVALLLVTSPALRPQYFGLLVGAGLLYSAGFTIYVVERPNPVPGLLGFHEIWHVIVLVAALLHAVLIGLVIG